MSRIGYTFTLNKCNDKVQKKALKDNNCEHIFSDNNGKRTQREKCFRELKKGDSLTVYNLNVLADNVNELHLFINILDKNKISLIALQEKIEHRKGRDNISKIICAMAKIEKNI